MADVFTRARVGGAGSAPAPRGEPLARALDAEDRAPLRRHDRREEERRQHRRHGQRARADRPRRRARSRTCQTRRVRGRSASKPAPPIARAPAAPAASASGARSTGTVTTRTRVGASAPRSARSTSTQVGERQRAGRVALGLDHREPGAEEGRRPGGPSGRRRRGRPARGRGGSTPRRGSSGAIGPPGPAVLVEVERPAICLQSAPGTCWMARRCASGVRRSRDDLKRCPTTRRPRPRSGATAGVIATSRRFGSSRQSPTSLDDARGACGSSESMSDESAIGTPVRARAADHRGRTRTPSPCRPRAGSVQELRAAATAAGRYRATVQLLPRAEPAKPWRNLSAGERLAHRRALAAVDADEPLRRHGRRHVVERRQRPAGAAWMYPRNASTA